MEVKTKLTKIALIIIGTFAIFLGLIGIILPVLPTTPFLLLSAFCYVRSSEKLYSWLINNKYLGKYIKDYRERGGIELKAKIMAFTLLWVSIGYSILFVLESIEVRLLMLVIASGVTIHLVSIKTLRDEESE